MDTLVRVQVILLINISTCVCMNSLCLITEKHERKIRLNR